MAIDSKRGLSMHRTRGGYAVQQRYRAEGRHPFEAANLAHARKVLAEHEAKERLKASGASPARPGDCARLPLP